MRIAGIDLGARTLACAFLAVFQVVATTVEAGVEEVTAGFSLEPTQFQERFQPRVEEVPLGGANSVDAGRGQRGALQRMLAAARRQIASINRRLHILRGSGDGGLSHAQLVCLRESTWGRGRGKDIIKLAEGGDVDAVKKLRRRLARSRCNLRAARRRKYRQARTKVDHFWRSAETWLAGTAHAAYVGILPPSILKLRRGMRESDRRPTKWVLQQARVVGAPARFKRFAEELQRGWVRLGPGDPTYGVGCASYEPTWEAYSTALCPHCKRLLNVGSKVGPRAAGRDTWPRLTHSPLRAKEIFACPCGWTESRDGSAARIIMLSGMQGLDFDVVKAKKRKREDADAKYEFAKEADLDGDADGGDDGGGAGSAAAAGGRKDPGGGDGGSSERVGAAHAGPARQGQAVRPQLAARTPAWPEI